MKKLVTLATYVVIILFTLSLYYYNEVGELFNSSEAEKEGFIYAIFDKNFRNADTWNLIWFFIFSMFFFLLMTLFDIRIMRLFIWLNKKFPYKAFAFFSSRWFRPVHVLLSCFIVGLIYVLLANGVIIKYGNSRMVSLDSIKSPTIIMIPGTNKYLRSFKSEKKENVYFKYRIEAARELWQAGKVESFLVSGDRTGEQGYDETNDIKNDLMAFGVPEELISLDTSGLRTHDSMIALRHYCSKKHRRDALLLSQAFQNRRALFMAPFFGIMAKGYSAKGFPTFAMAVREFLGKPKVLIDIFITNQQPKETQSVEVRERFGVTSKYHLYCVFSLFFAWMFFIIYMTKYWEKYETVSLVN